MLGLVGKAQQKTAMLGGFHSHGGTVPQNGWMVCKGKSQSEMDGDWGYPYSGNVHMFQTTVKWDLCKI